MNFRRLRYFVKIVDVGSLTQAADLLHIAQPALSQQIATLEAEMKQQLLIRTKRGVIPTDAGKTLYAHAQLILRQCEQAFSDVSSASDTLTGKVSVGLAPGTAASILAVPLLQRVREVHPGIVLYLNENFGTTLSELIMNGRMDMAVLYGGRHTHGLNFVPLLRERLYLVSADPRFADQTELELKYLSELDLLLPRPYNITRSLVDEACARIGCTINVIAEIESATTLATAVARRFGATILPESAARSLSQTESLYLNALTNPQIEAPLALCLSDHLPLSLPAQAVKALLLELVAEYRDPLIQPRAAAQSSLITRSELNRELSTSAGLIRALTVSSQDQC